MKALKALIEDIQKIMRLFISGAVLFFIGLGIIIWADKWIAPSLEQEAYALLGTVIGGLGFLTTMTAQVLLIIERFKRLDKK